MMKKCNKCDLIKNVSDFGVVKRNKDGLNYLCKTCDKKKSKTFRDENKEKIIKKP